MNPLSKTQIMEKISVPMDIYESTKEMTIIIPLSWVDKKSMKIWITNYQLFITGQRKGLQMREDMQAVKQDCYRGDFEQVVSLPNGINFEKIHSKFTSENILIVTIPKIYIPETVSIELE